MGKRVLLVLCCFLLGLGAGTFYRYQRTSDTEILSPIITSFGIRSPEIIGFLPYWLLDKADKDYSSYLTTLTYFGLTISSDGSIQKFANPREQEPGWTALDSGRYADYASRAKAGKLAQSLLVFSGDDAAILEMIQTPEISAARLVSDVAPIMRDGGFNDLNLDVEGFADASESARVLFTRFVGEVKRLIDQEKLGTLTFDLIPIALIKEKLYDAKALGEIVDRMVLMTYDYHYLGGLTTGAVAPLGGGADTMDYDVQIALQEALKLIPREKILLGIPLYGYEWETIAGTPEAATIPGGAATASVRRISEFLATCASCSAQFDPISRSPYVIYKKDEYFNQIYFENEHSIEEKVALAKKYEIAGVALWALGYEDDVLLRPLTSYKRTIIAPWSTY